MNKIFSQDNYDDYIEDYEEPDLTPDVTLERDRLDSALLAELPLQKLTEAEEKSQTQLRIELFQKGSTFRKTSRGEIVGIDNVLGEIDEIIHWLRHAPEYSIHNSRLQPGVIFSGYPGTGKTLVSRWIASESDALFINVRDFVHNAALFTDADIRDLFMLARATHKLDKRPILLFWDEFENSAAERSGEKTTPEQRSVVSQLTAELDGIHGKNEGILLIGCTNYQSSIDQALMRRGRMGVQIEFHAPDRHGKEKILSYYLGQMTCESTIDVDTLSYFFPKHNTAADIEEACVEAWRHAVRRSIDAKNDPCIRDHDLVRVFIKQLVGPPTTFTLPENERMPIAIHESGHAIAALAFGVPLRLITVQPGKKSLGRVMTDDLQEYIGTVPEMINQMKTQLGGIAAERAAELPAMTGATNDIKRLNETAEWLVDNLTAGTRTGLFNVTSLGRTSGYSSLVPQASAEVIRDSDLDVMALIDQVESDVTTLMSKIGKDNVWRIAQGVNERVTMTGKEFNQLFIDVCGVAPSAL